MKKTAIALVLLFFISSFVKAQENKNQYLINSQNIPQFKISGFGGPFMSLTTINNKAGLMFGGQGAVTLFDRLYIGAYSQSLVSNNHTSITIVPGFFLTKKIDADIHFTHTGLLVGYFWKPYKKIHFNLSSRFGWGSLSLKSSELNNEGNANLPQNKIFTAIPEIGVNFSLTSWLKINSNIGYQFISKRHSQNNTQSNFFNTNDYQGLQGNISLLFGFFE
ncbi:MAG: hypothetical protein ACEPOW_12085 [Bacteroidales bacterium]